MKPRTKLTLLLLLSVASPLFSQTLFDREMLAVTPRAGLSYNMHSGGFSQFLGMADCGIYERGSGIGPSFSLGAERALNAKFQAELDFKYIDRAGLFEIDNFFPSRDMATGEVRQVNTKNKLDVTSLGHFEIHALFKYVWQENFINGPLRIVAGPRFAFPMSGEFRQYEEIASPENAVFINNDGTRTQMRDIASGSIRTLGGFVPGFTIGLENLLKVGEKDYLTQSLVYDISFGDVLTDAKWKTNALRLEVGYRFSIEEPEPEPAPIPEPEPEPVPEPPVVIKEPDPSLSLTVADGLEDPKVLISTELLATIPVVNAVFFETGSDRIPTPYKTGDEGFPDYFSGDPIARHYEIIPRVAAIMKSNPGLNLTLIGSTSGAENEAEGLALAKRRAENVAAAFERAGIDRKRIITQHKLLPDIPTAAIYPEAKIENQRVEILLPNSSVQQFVDIQTSARLTGKIRADVSFENLEQGKFPSVYNDLVSDVLKAIRPKEYKLPVDKTLINPDDTISHRTVLKYKDLAAEDTSYIDLNSLPKEMTGLDLSKFRAVLRFDFASSQLSFENKQLLKQLSDKLPEGSTIIIEGSTDALGTEEANRQLANARATETMNYIRNVAGEKFTFETKTTTDKFEESTPQGRFLNRSIRIRVTR